MSVPPLEEDEQVLPGCTKCRHAQRGCRLCGGEGWMSIAEETRQALARAATEHAPPAGPAPAARAVRMVGSPHQPVPPSTRAKSGSGRAPRGLQLGEVPLEGSMEADGGQGSRRRKVGSPALLLRLPVQVEPVEPAQTAAPPASLPTAPSRTTSRQQVGRYILLWDADGETWDMHVVTHHLVASSTHRVKRIKSGTVTDICLRHETYRDIDPPSRSVPQRAAAANSL
jgi:hypothetical protein